MKTSPMKHQEVGVARLAAAPKGFMLGCEQGTGKTWMLLADAEHQFNAGLIDAVLVLAPKGVHTNWVLREIPTHTSVPTVSAYYLAGGGVRRKAAIERVFRNNGERELRILAINIDAIIHKEGYDLARRLLRTYRTMMIVDESQRIKSMDSARTQKAILLGRMAVSRRASSGTPITNSPVDIFSQIEFIAPEQALLGTTSHKAFFAEYAVLLDADSVLMKAIKERTRARGTPQIVARDTEGKPKWRNLDKLGRLLEPIMYRVLKADCLDLPEKIYKTIYFELEPKQQAIYDMVEEKMRLEREDGDFDIFTALTKINKLRQVTSGFVIVDGEATVLRIDSNPRMQALKSLVEDIDGQFIVWASFVEELSQIMVAMEACGLKAVQYSGKISSANRERAIDDFQNGKATVFVGQPVAGGVGLTLTAAKTVVYYSSDYNLGTRLQSEDRCHRIGTTTHVVYIDLAATDTIDEKIASALQIKEELSQAVLFRASNSNRR